jgi:hypothetical protein
LLDRTQDTGFHSSAVGGRGKEVTEEKFYLEYKEVLPGLKWAVKFLVKKDGDKHAKLELTDIRSVGPFDASVFAKPN